MKNFMNKYLRFCPKTGKFKGFKRLTGLSRLFFPLAGIGALIWFLVRVIPKPDRVSYPCMRVAYPIASTFVIYLLGLAASAFALGKMKEHWRNSRYWAMAGFSIVAIVAGFFSFQADQPPVFANVSTLDSVNVPMGEAKGIFPGRVVWVHDPNATNENWIASTNSGTGWFLPANNDQAVIDGMVSSAMQTLTGQTTDSASWKAIFEFHNNTRGKGTVNYSPGEKIFIKTNVVSGWSGNFSLSDLSKTGNSYYNVTETSPAMVLAVLRQLVNVVGVAEKDIYVGDPLRHVYKHCYDLWHAEFDSVHYLDYSYSTLGREKVVVSATAKISYSDRGAVLRNNTNNTAGTTPIYRDNLYTIFEDAEYMINLPMLKGHRRAGATMFAKNHFGSHTRDGAPHLHNGLVAPWEDTTFANPLAYRKGYGLYRVQVDMMSHSLLGKKNLVYLMDALWATDHELDKPLKWQMAPFNNDWMSSVFASLDNVAIESVGYDFLRSEFTAARGSCLTVVQMDGVDDYLHQAADSANWADGIQYDPDSTGTLFASLGVHEHWNNSADMKYSRNLDPANGAGVELVTPENGTFIAAYDRSNRPEGFELHQNYPNPFNPATTIAYTLPERSSVNVTIYDIQGRTVKSFMQGTQSAGSQRIVWNGTNNFGKIVSSGIYIYKVTVSSLNSGNMLSKSAKMILLK